MRRNAEQGPSRGFRVRLHEIIFESETPEGRAFDIALFWAIVLSVIIVLLESVASIRQGHGEALRVGEWLFTIAFTIEYALRLMLPLSPRAADRGAYDARRKPFADEPPPATGRLRPDCAGDREDQRQRPQTMLHSDVHPGNWYVTKDGGMGLCDWQCVVQGGWARDIAYALASHLTPEDRRTWERDLIARHGERLAEAGIRPPSFDEAFLAYRRQMPHAMMMWLATLGRLWSHPVFQAHDVTLETVRRICTAADDLETLDALA